MVASNITTGGESGAASVITYSISNSIPIHYHTQLQSWLNEDLEQINNLYFRNYKLIHTVQQDMFLAIEYDDGDSVWVSMEAYQLDPTANEEYADRKSGKITSSIAECADGKEECKIDIKKRETKVLTLSILTSFISGTYTINIHDGKGNQDALHFSRPVATLAHSYSHNPPDAIIIKPGPPSDSGQYSYNLNTCYHSIILGWDVVFSNLQNRDLTRTLELPVNEIKVVIPITLIDNPNYFFGDTQSVVITVGVDQNKTGEVIHNITLTQSEEVMESADVPDIFQVSL